MAYNVYYISDNRFQIRDRDYGHILCSVEFESEFDHGTQERVMDNIKDIVVGEWNGDDMTEEQVRKSFVEGITRHMRV